MQEWQSKKQFSPENVFELLQASPGLGQTAGASSDQRSDGLELCCSRRRPSICQQLAADSEEHRASGGPACSGHLAGDATGRQQRDSAEGAGDDGRHGIHSADLRCPGKPH